MTGDNNRSDGTEDGNATVSESGRHAAVDEDEGTSLDLSTPFHFVPASHEEPGESSDGDADDQAIEGEVEVEEQNSDVSRETTSGDAATWDVVERNIDPATLDPGDLDAVDLNRDELGAAGYAETETRSAEAPEDVGNRNDLSGADGTVPAGVSRETFDATTDRSPDAAPDEPVRDVAPDTAGTEEVTCEAPSDPPREPDEQNHIAGEIESGEQAEPGNPGGLQPTAPVEADGTDGLAAACVADDGSTGADAQTGDSATVRVAPAAVADASPHADSETPIAREAAQAVHVLNVRQEQWPRPPATRVLTIANQKGGVGKTTSAVNVAAALALHGVRVLLIDLDPQGNASTALGIEHGVGTPSIYDVLLSDRPIVEVVQTADFAPLLQCVPSTLDLAGADIELTSQVAREYRLQHALQVYLDDEQHPGVDYVLIDCPPSLGLLTLNALVAAREVLLPIQCEYYALEGLAQLLKTVDLVTSHLNPQLQITTVLLTMYDSRTRLADQVADEVRRHFGELVLAPTIPRNVRVSEAPGFGQTVITYDAGSRGAISYLQAARELAERGLTSIGAAAHSDGTEDGR